MNENSGVMQVLSYTADKTLELANANSIVGDAIEKDGVTVIPISQVSVGFAGGGADISQGKNARHPAGAGGKVDRKPTAFLILDEGGVRVQGAAPYKKDSATELMDSIKKLFQKKK